MLGLTFCKLVMGVIASEVKQTRLLPMQLDCFVALLLAMTASARAIVNGT